MGRLVAVRPHPLRLDRQIVAVEPGRSVAEIVERVLPEPWRPHAVVVLDGAPLERERWAIVPKEGQTITVTVRPGSREVLAPVLQLAIVVAAAAFGQYWAAALKLGPVGASALTASLTATGMLAARALIPPPALRATGGRGRGPQSWALTGAQNDARVWGPIPRVLGEIRYVPPLAGSPIPELSGDDQHLRVALCWGYGPLEVADLRIGETPIDQYQHEHEYWPGTPGQRPTLATWSADVAVEVVDVIVRAADTPPVRRSAPDAREVVVQLEWPRGLVDLGSGERDSIAVEYAIDTAPAGTTDWAEQIRQTVRRKSTSAVRVAHRIAVTGQVDVRVRRITRDRKDAAKADETRWTYLQTIQAGEPITAEGVAISVLRVIAGPQSSGTVGPISGVVRSVLPDWTGTAWVERPTRNPAALALAVLRGPGARRPVADERIDLAAFQDWHDYCRVHGLTCDLVVDWDGATVGEILDLVAGCGDALVRPIDGRWTPLIDRAQAAPVQLFTPRNSGSIQWARSYLPVPDALRIRYLDRDADYRPAEVVVTRTGAPPSGGALVDDLELQGVTDRALAIRHGRRRLAELELRRETWTVQVGWDHLACRPGDRVAIAHDVLVVSLGAGRIAALETDTSGNVTAIAIDEPVDTVAGTSYGVTIRRPGAVTTHALAGVDGTITRLPLATPIPAASAPAVGDLVVVGELGRETIPALVARIRPAADWAAALELVPYDERLYAVDGEPPLLDGRVALGALARPIIRAVERSDGIVRVVLVPTQPTPIGAHAVEIGWGVDAGETVETASPGARVIVLAGAPADRTVTVRARWRYAYGPGPWSPAVVSEPVIASPPLPPRGVAISDDRLTWQPSPTPDVRYEIRWAPAGQTYERSSVLAITTETHYTLGLAVAAAELWVVAVASTGARSEPVHVRWSAPPATGVEIWRHSERQAGWPGWLRGGSRETGQITGAQVLGWWPDPDAPMWPDPEGPFAADASGGPPWVYPTRVVIPATVTAYDVALGVTPADRVVIEPQASLGEIRRVAVVYERDLIELPWAGEIPWQGGIYWRSIEGSPLLEWPRAVDARPGEALYLLIEGSGTCTDVVVRLLRQPRRHTWPALAVPAAGVTVVPPGSRVAVLASATPLQSGVTVSAERTGAGVRVVAVDQSGAPTAASVDLVVEYL